MISGFRTQECDTKAEYFLGLNMYIRLLKELIHCGYGIITIKINAIYIIFTSILKNIILEEMKLAWNRAAGCKGKCSWTNG